MHPEESPCNNCEQIKYRPPYTTTCLYWAVMYVTTKTHWECQQMRTWQTNRYESIPIDPWQTSALELLLVSYIHILLVYHCAPHLWNINFTMCARTLSYPPWYPRVLVTRFMAILTLCSAQSVFDPNLFRQTLLLTDKLPTGVWLHDTSGSSTENHKLWEQSSNLSCYVQNCTFSFTINEQVFTAYLLLAAKGQPTQSPKHSFRARKMTLAAI